MPAGFTQSDIWLVVGGYKWKARFLDQNGYIITDAPPGEPYGNNQWNLMTLRWVDYSPAANGTKKYDCGKCHTTGYSPTGNQEGKPGVVGTWALPNIQCERCHGPGSEHVSDPPSYNMTVDTSAAACGACHTRGSASTIPAEGGFIRHHEQYNEFLASPHSPALTCASCHDSHKKAPSSIIADCESCHSDVAAAYEGSRKDQLGLGCATCHMPMASKSADALGTYRGDLKTHLFNINTDPNAQMFTSDGKFVQLGFGGDPSKGAVTLEFACLSCHQNRDKQWAATYAPTVHTLPAEPGGGGGGAGPHGNYSPDTSKCAACHRAHTAIGAELIVAEDEYALCTSCHDGSGATTNVLGGYVIAGSLPRLNSGGFETMPMTGYPGEPGAPIVEVVTSTHTVEGLGDSSGLGTAWGSLGPGGQGPGVQGTLECTSCHNPHGSTNYRILRDSDNGYPYDDPAAHRWVPNDPYLKDWQNNQVLATDNLQGGTNPYSTNDKGNYTSGMNFFCATCHTEYLQPSQDAGVYNPSAPYNADDGKGAVPRFRHAVVQSYDEPRPLRFAAMASLSVDNDGDGYWDPGDVFDETTAVPLTTREGFTCLTCHFAHGTAAQYEGYAANVPPTNDSALLYYDNRGVCRACHMTTK
jgi:predicted CXXCH cytochrome family protein